MQWLSNSFDPRQPSFVKKQFGGTPSYNLLVKKVDIDTINWLHPKSYSRNQGFHSTQVENHWSNVYICFFFIFYLRRRFLSSGSEHLDHMKFLSHSRMLSSFLRHEITLLGIVKSPNILKICNYLCKQSLIYLNFAFNQGSLFFSN